MFKKNQLLMLLLLGTVAAPAFGMKTSDSQNNNNAAITVKDQNLTNSTFGIPENKDENANLNNLNKVEKIEENNNDEEIEAVIPEKEKNSFLSTLHPTTEEIKVDGKTLSVPTYDAKETFLSAVKTKYFLVATDQDYLEAAKKVVDNDKTNSTFINHKQETVDEKKTTTYYTVTLTPITANNFFKRIFPETVGDENDTVEFSYAATVLAFLKYATNLKLTAKIRVIDSSLEASWNELEDDEYLVYNDITKQYYAVKIKAADKEEPSCFIDNVFELSKVSKDEGKGCVYSEASINSFVEDLGLTLVPAKKDSKGAFKFGKDTYMKLQPAHKLFWNVTQTTGQALLSAFFGFWSGFTLGNKSSIGYNQQASWIAPYVTSAFCGGSVLPVNYKKTSSIGHPFTISPKKTLITLAAYAGNIAARACNPNI